MSNGREVLPDASLRDSVAARLGRVNLMIALVSEQEADVPERLKTACSTLNKAVDTSGFNFLSQLEEQKATLEEWLINHQQ